MFKRVYSEKLPRRQDGRSPSPRGSPSRSPSPRRSGSRSPSPSPRVKNSEDFRIPGSPRTRQQKSPKGRKQRSKEDKEAKLVSQVVRLKLEDYFNVKLREQRFDIWGRCRTTRRMEHLDTAYQLADHINFEQSSSKAPRHQRRRPKTSSAQISAKIVNNSRRMVQYAEAERLEKQVNKIYKSLPIPALVELHSTARLKPGATSHMGAALYTHRLYEFYDKQDKDSRNTSKPAARATRHDDDSSESDDSSDENDRKNNNK